MAVDPNTNKLDYAGLTRYHGKIQQEFDQQNGVINMLKSLHVGVDNNGKFCYIEEEEA